MNNIDPFAKSGTNLEVDIAEKLRNFWWWVKTKQHYLDPFENKPREIDIIASRKIEINDKFSSESVVFEMKLFFECKYLPDVKGLYVRNNDINKNLESFLNLSVYNDLCGDFFHTYRKISDYYSNHRYLIQKEIVYDSSDNSEKWFWVPAIKQVIHGMMSKNHKSNETYSVEYGIIIADNSKKISLRRDWKRENDNFTQPLLFWIDYVSTSGRSVFYLVDVISLDQLDNFLLERWQEFDLLKNEIVIHASWERQKINQELYWWDISMN